MLLVTAPLPAQQKPAAKAASANPATDVAARLERAAQFADSGKLDAARAEYERLLKQGAGAQIESSFMHARRLGLCYLNGAPQNLNEAAKWLGIAHRLNANDTDVALYYGQSLAWSGRNDEAVRIYDDLRKSHPRNADYVIGLANAQFAKGDTASALGLLERFTQEQPSNLPVRLLYARFLGYTKQYVPSIAQYQLVLQSDPSNLDAKIGVAKVNSWQGNNDIALEMYDKVLRVAPRNYDALVGKAYSLLWLGRKTEARQIFAVINERNPADKEIAATLKSLPAPAPSPAKIVAKAETPPAKALEAARAPAEDKPAVIAQAESAAVASPPPPAAEPTREEKTAELITAAQQSTNAGNFAEAIHRYHEVLAMDPDSRGAELQIARLLSWSKSYDDSVAAYEHIIEKDPRNVNAQAERARVLSWAKRFPESLKAYEEALQAAPSCTTKECPSERTLRIEYARVLSWSGRYDDSLAQYEQVNLPASPTNDDERAAALDRARTLAWAKRYPEASAQFDSVAQSGGDTFDARLGKAQVTYWSGDVRGAALQLRRLSAEKPKDATVALTLASVEHNLGYNARALSLLSVAEPGMEADSLRETIRKDLRPILRFRYGYENDLEIESNNTQSSIKVLRYTSSIEFNIHPDVRMQVVNSVTNALTSNALLGKHSGDNVAVETLARFNFRVTPWLSMSVGGGVGVSGGSSLGKSAAHTQHALYEIHPTITRGKLRLDFAANRRLAEYTPLAIADNVVQTRLTSAASYSWHRFRTGAEYWHGYYTVESPEPNLGTHFSAEGNGGSLYVTGSAIRNEKFTADLGMRYDSFGFDQGGLHISDPANGIGSAGFFTPRLYQRYAGTANLGWVTTPRLRFDLGGTFGPQRVFGYGELSPPARDWGTTGSVDLSSTYTYKALSLTAGYGFFSTETASFPGFTNGTYQSHVASLQLTYRF